MGAFDFLQGAPAQPGFATPGTTDWGNFATSGIGQDTLDLLNARQNGGDMSGYNIPSYGWGLNGGKFGQGMVNTPVPTGINSWYGDGGQLKSPNGWSWNVMPTTAQLQPDGSPSPNIIIGTDPSTNINHQFDITTGMPMGSYKNRIDNSDLLMAAAVLAMPFGGAALTGMGAGAAGAGAGFTGGTFGAVDSGLGAQIAAGGAGGVAGGGGLAAGAYGAGAGMAPAAGGVFDLSGMAGAALPGAGGGASFLAPAAGTAGLALSQGSPGSAFSLDGMSPTGSGLSSFGTPTSAAGTPGFTSDMSALSGGAPLAAAGGGGGVGGVGGASSLGSLVSNAGALAPLAGAIFGSQPVKQTTTQTAQLPPYLQGPVAGDLIPRTQGLLNSQMPLAGAAGGQMVQQGSGLLSAPAAGNGYGQVKLNAPTTSTNPYLPGMANDIQNRTQQMLAQNNLDIQGNSVGAGGLGGSRQGVAQGIAAGRAADYLSGNLANMYGAQYSADQNRALQQYGQDQSFYGQQRGQDLASYGVGSGLVGAGLSSQFSPLQSASGIYSPFSGFGTTTGVQSQGGGAMGAAGGALGAAQFANNMGWLGGSSNSVGPPPNPYVSSGSSGGWW